MGHSIDQKDSRGRASSHQGRRRTVHVSSQEVGSWQQSSTSSPIGSECVGRAVSQSEVPPPKSRHAVLPPPLCPECKAVSMRSPHTKTCNKFPHDVLVDTRLGPRMIVTGICVSRYRLMQAPIWICMVPPMNQIGYIHLDSISC